MVEAWALESDPDLPAKGYLSVLLVRFVLVEAWALEGYETSSAK